MAKGYQEPQEGTAEKMAAVVNVTGLIGTVSNLWERIEAELKARDWNWRTLADEVPCSRQYLAKCCETGQMPATHFRRLVDIFEWKVSDLIDLEWKPEPETTKEKPKR